MNGSHRVETTLQQDGTLTLDQLPFRAGQAVEVIILPHPKTPDATFPLRGTPVRYDLPMEPVGEEEWEAQK